MPAYRYTTTRFYVEGTLSREPDNMRVSADGKPGDVQIEFSGSAFD